jgi:hypothetical protein
MPMHENKQPQQQEQHGKRHHAGQKQIVRA